MTAPLTLPCPDCNGDGFLSFEDRHTETAKEVCERCGGDGTIPAAMGESSEAAFAVETVKRTESVHAAFRPDPGTEWTVVAEATPDGPALTVAFTLYGAPATLRLVMDRPDARTLAAGLLAAAGDATARTLPPVETTEARS